MTFITCKIRKGRECKKPVEVCKVCKKRGRCESFQKWSQPELRSLPVRNSGSETATSAGVANFRENG